MVVRRALLILLIPVIVTLATDGRAQDEEVSPTDLYDRLDLYACPDLSYLVYQMIPDYFYNAEADSLLELIYYWDMACGPAEPIVRTSILGAIWDRAFDESLYDSTIMHYLIWRYDPVRLGDKPDEVYPEMASGDVAREMDFVGGRDDFDLFTKDLADQLLPHQQQGSLQEFFCLYYAGLPDSAYTMLQGDELVGTDLRWYYDNTLQQIRDERWVPSVAVTGGYWLSEGKLGVVGDHCNVGLLGAVRDRGWLFRLALDVRLGRSDNPYYVSKGEIDEWSDRFNGVFATLDIGRTLLAVGRNKFDLFVGLGVLSLKPFSDSELTINGLAYTLGGGYRCYLGQRRRWFVGADGQHEWIDELKTGGTVLEGGGWNWRLALGRSFGSDNDRRLQGLGQ